jgi:hypothetical protein
MQFDLNEIVHPNLSIDFQSLEVPLTKEETKNIIKCMPTDKSPSPDGFNGSFLKRSWSIVKVEF